MIKHAESGYFHNYVQTPPEHVYIWCFVPVTGVNETLQIHMTWAKSVILTVKYEELHCRTYTCGSAHLISQTSKSVSNHDFVQ